MKVLLDYYYSFPEEACIGAQLELEEEGEKDVTLTINTPNKDELLNSLVDCREGTILSITVNLLELIATLRAIREVQIGTDSQGGETDGMDRK